MRLGRRRGPARRPPASPAAGASERYALAVSDQAEPVRVENCRHDLGYSWQCLRRDWARNDSQISRVVLLIYRLGHFLQGGRAPSSLVKLFWPVYRFADLVWSKLLAGAELDPAACIGPGLWLPHGGRGVVVGIGVEIGPDVVIYHQVTVGAVDINPGVWPLPVPVVEGEVRIGTGARVLGQIRVGRNALVGVNALVLTDVPAGKTVAATPARIVF
jgi:serine O-acetyltransferase